MLNIILVQFEVLQFVPMELDEVIGQFSIRASKWLSRGIFFQYLIDYWYSLFMFSHTHAKNNNKSLHEIMTQVRS